MEDVRRSILMKAEEIGELRAQTLTEGRRDAARRRGGAARGRARARARERRLGHRRDRSRGRPPARAAGAAIDLTGDPAILTAIANDVGVEAIFARQVIAYGRPGDALVALSTSGGSGERDRRARRGAPARARHDRLRRLRRRPDRRRADSPTTSWSRARSTSRGSRRRRRAPTTSSASWWDEGGHPRQAPRRHRRDGDDRRARVRRPRGPHPRGPAVAADAQAQGAPGPLEGRARALGDGRHVRDRLRAAAGRPAARVVGPVYGVLVWLGFDAVSRPRSG